MQKLYKKTALITGATQGLGAALAMRFAQEGANLILLGRTIKALEAIDDQLAGFEVETTLVPLDLTESNKLESLGLSLATKYESIDIMVGNAATLGQLSPLTHQPPQLWQDVFDVNFQANFHLLRILNPLLRRSAAPRVIFVTCHVAQQTLPYWGAYAISKAALEHMAFLYAAENENTPMRVNVIDPGPMSTRLYFQAIPGADKSKIPLPETVTDYFVYLASEDCQKTGQLHKVNEYKISDT